MYSFILKRQPKSFNSWRGASVIKKASYKSAIKSSFRKFKAKSNISSDELYGVVYYFYKIDLESDADNLSKPLWDCLNGVLFFDDNQVKLRVAGSFDLLKNNFSTLNLTNIPGDIAGELLDAVDNENHFVYVEVGLLNYNMFKFNLNANGN